MKKEKKVFLACIALLFLTVLTVYVISGTYARYSSQITGTSTARAAKWAWKINNQDLTAGTTEVDLNLFETILSTDDNAEQNVKQGSRENIIGVKLILEEFL